MPKSASESPPSPRRKPFQFGLATLLAITTLVAVLASILGAMLRGNQAGTKSSVAVWAMMAVAAPVGIMILVSLYQALRRSKRP